MKSVPFDIQSFIAILVGLCTLGGVLFAAHRWVLAQDKLREDVKEQLAIQNVENQVLCYGLLACLDGLEQLGCNHNVTKAHEALEKHINRRAHGNGGT